MLRHLTVDCVDTTTARIAPLVNGLPLSLIALLCFAVVGCSSGDGSGDDTASPESMSTDTMPIGTPVVQDDEGADRPDEPGRQDVGDEENDDTSVADQSVVDGLSTYRRAPGVDACSTQDMNDWVEFDMRDYYLFYRDVADIDTGNFTDLDDLVKALRAPQDTFSFATDAQASDDRDDGLFDGYGYWIRFDSSGVLRFREVDVGGPASEAGVQRGDALVALNGIPAGELSNERYFDVINQGYDTPPVFSVARDNQPARDIVIAPGRYRKVFSPDASTVQLQNGSLVGYLPLTDFKMPAVDQLDAHITWLLEQGIDDLVLDLRYNPGGISDVTIRLASQLIGSRFEGQRFIRREFNDRYASDAFDQPFESAVPELELNRLVVLTTEHSASAAEMLPNGLSAWMDVVTIGETTSGKAYGSNRVDLCGQRLFAIRTVRQNARGESVEGGLQPDCAVADTWNTRQDDVSDALFGTALQYLENNACPDIPLALRNRQQRQPVASFERRPVENSRPLDLYEH